ncbi:hypothetical protein [Treponema sp. R6D11]
METYWDDGQTGEKLNVDNKIHSRAYRIKAAFAGNLRRASYTTANRAALVLPHNFQNLSPLASPFTANV